MLINMKEMLTIAQENKFAVPAYNIGSAQILTAVVEAAEENNAPVILAIHPDELSFIGESFIKTVIDEAHKSRVPMVIHLDHGGSFEDCLKAIRCGFTSVMIDGSMLPYEENIAITKKVVEAAKPLNVSVEGELGTIGNVGNSAEGGTDEIIFTDPEVAKDFVDKTNVDTLAIAIGTSHGIYPKDLKPKLKLDLLTEIREKVENTPLVLHGGSSNTDSEIAESVQRGISKINISSDIKQAFYDACREYLDANPNALEPNAIYPSCIAASKEVMKEKFELFNTVDKSKLYY